VEDRLSEMDDRPNIDALVPSHTIGEDSRILVALAEDNDDSFLPCEIGRYINRGVRVGLAGTKWNSYGLESKLLETFLDDVADHGYEL
jgi:hypothetical protein